MSTSDRKERSLRDKRVERLKRKRPLGVVAEGRGGFKCNKSRRVLEHSSC